MTAAGVIDQLRRRGELWEPAPGLVALRGDVLELRTRIEAELRALAAVETREEWQLPPAVPFETLARADYFAAFPQWLTATAHLDSAELADVAAAADPSRAAMRALRPSAIALQPAVCYHVYAALAGAQLERPHVCTTCGTCWRHEAGRFMPLERGWSFTMREIVVAGSASDVSAFRERTMHAAVGLAQRLELEPQIVEATDPFFAPNARGRALLQRIRALKHELVLPLGDRRSTAAASFNDHAGFFGAAFDIRLAGGTPAATGCAAFGIERWLLAVLVRHGTDARTWPLMGAIAEERTEWLAH